MPAVGQEPLMRGQHLVIMDVSCERLFILYTLAKTDHTIRGRHVRTALQESIHHT